MKSVSKHVNRIVFQVHTNAGDSKLEIGMDHMTQLERRSILEVIGKTAKGGTVGFGMEPNDDGTEYILKFILRRPVVQLLNA